MASFVFVSGHLPLVLYVRSWKSSTDTAVIGTRSSSGRHYMPKEQRQYGRRKRATVAVNNLLILWFDFFVLSYLSFFILIFLFWFILVLWSRFLSCSKYCLFISQIVFQDENRIPCSRDYRRIMASYWHRFLINVSNFFFQKKNTNQV